MGKGSGTAGRGDKASRGVKSPKSNTNSKEYANTEENVSKLFYYTRIEDGALKKFKSASIKEMSDNMAEVARSYGLELEPAAFYGPVDNTILKWNIQKDGRSVGTMTREYITTKEGTIVKHSLFELKKSFQGKDLGKKLLAAQLKFNQKAGFDTIQLHANIDVGGYAWARYGFKMKQDDAIKMRGAIKRKYGEGSPVEKAWSRAIQKETTNGYTHIKKVVDEYRKELKPIMLGSKWHGAINLRDKKNVNEYAGYLSSSTREIGAVEGTRTKKKGR